MGNFGVAIKALKEGKRVAREGWNGKGLFVFKQVPASVRVEIIPKMTSVPDSVKNEMMKRKQALSYNNQMAIVNTQGDVDSWVPSSSDVFAEDWLIVE